MKPYKLRLRNDKIEAPACAAFQGLIVGIQDLKEFCKIEGMVGIKLAV